MGKIGLLLVAAMAGALGACDARATVEPPAYGDGTGEARVELPSAPEPKRFSKTEFTAYVAGKTKEAIRVEFGSPTAVNDDDDSWFYGFLPIYDPDAGTQASVRIRFAGIEGSDDPVVEVWYP